MTTRVAAYTPAAWIRDGLVITALAVAHEAMKRSLADGALVAALLSPGGAHSAVTLLLGLLLVLVRCALVVGVPAFVVGKAFELSVARLGRWSLQRQVRAAFHRNNLPGHELGPGDE
jgi:hypothetical protein